MKHEGSELDRAVLRRWRHLKAKMEPQIREAFAANPRMTDPEMAVALVVTENVLNACIISAMQQGMPQGRDFFVELATRSAAMILTALEPDDQEQGALLVQQGLLNKLADKQASGHVLVTQWGEG